MTVHLVSGRELVAAREQAQAAGDDLELLRLREIELAMEGLPSVIDGARRVRLLHHDPISSTWDAWSTVDGQRVLLRCLLPRWRKDPVLRRRMAAGVPMSGVTWCPDGDWPHLRARVDGPLIVDRLPAEDPADPVFLARLLLGALQGLGALHQEGRVHGGPLAVHLVEPVQRSGGAAGCCRLLWLDSFGVTRRPADDMAELGRLVRDLTPGEAGPLAQLVTTWDQNPPASAEDAMALVRQALAARLLDERHRLARLSRSTLRRRQIMRLYRLVEELQQVVPPPAGRVCLRAGIDGVLVLAESDGARVGGGISPDPATRFVPTIYGPDRGLDAQRGRQLLRAWALRDRGDEELRTQVQDQIGGTDQQAERLVRWLSTMARLRATRLMLGAQGGVSRPVPVASDYSTDRVNR